MITIAEVFTKMIAYSHGNMHDINHFTKVWAYAKTIGKLEKIDTQTQYTLELSAIIHDIACPLCRHKYGNTEGHLQEKEGKALTKDFLADLDIPDAIKDRIVYLVSHHHTYTQIDAIDYQILVEADFLVNIDESHYSLQQIQSILTTIFKTQSGITLLKELYLS